MRAATTLTRAGITFVRGISFLAAGPMTPKAGQMGTFRIHFLK